MKARRIWPVIVSAGLGIAVLCGLGVWQVLRLGEKEKFLVELNARAAASPITLAQALQGNDIEFTRIKAGGHYDFAHTLYKQASVKGGPGWQLITPFIGDDGVAVLVDRGAVPEELKTQADTAQPAAITGIARLHDGGQGLFDPDNDMEGNIWYWWDVPAMLAAARLPAEAKTAPFILQVIAEPNAPRYPIAAEPDAGIRNNHLQYAITWFALAFVLLVVAGLFIRKETRP
jgi:surfeit locus 1 family protein